MLVKEKIVSLILINMELYENNKKKILAISVAILLLTGLVIGLVARPVLDRGIKNVKEMFGTYEVKNVVYEGTEEQRAVESIIKRPEFQENILHQAKWIYNKEMTAKYMALEEKHNMLSLVEFGRMDTGISELASSSKDNVKGK
jgi:hypothetical protein